MTVPEDLLYQLLPGVHRLRDGASDEALRQFLEVLTDQAAVLDDAIARLHEDLFVETAAAWVLPYLGEVVGVRGLPGGQSYGMTPRAEVANTIAYRRRKGTAAVLEQLARDVTGWPARAVEYFELIAATQSVNHVRPRATAVTRIGDAARLAWVGTPFERAAGHDDLTHLVDVRRIGGGRGRYNIPNLGLHVWRLREYGHTLSRAVPADPGDARRFLVSPLGRDTALVTRPVTEAEITHLAEPVNVPLPIPLRDLAADPGRWYGPGLSVVVDGVPPTDVLACDLRDVTDGSGTVIGWAHTPPPPGRVALDPVRGRVAFPADRAQAPLVTYHDAFAADVGGGEYPRADGLGDIDGAVERVSRRDPLVGHPSLSAALAALGGSPGTVEVLDGDRYHEDPELAATGRRLEVRAGDGHRPVVVLSGELAVTGDDDGELTLNGLLLIGGALRVTGLRRLRLRHCTLVPGLALDTAGEPVEAGAASLVVESASTSVELDSCILGGLRVHPEADLTARRCIVDAGVTGVAYASADGAGAGGTLRLSECTVLGKVDARVLELVSNSLLFARLAAADDPARWPGPVLAERRQSGCVRFSWVPVGSRTPRRHRCQPPSEALAGRLQPVLTSTRYGDPGYCQMSRRTPDAVARGADDESEMGAFHDLYQPQREQHLRTRLDEYLPFGLEAGVFFAS